MFNSMPLDIIIEILSRLPVKPLLRLTSVCKAWNSLITSPHFISNHLKQSNLNPSSRNALIITVLDYYLDDLYMLLLYEDSFNKQITIDLFFVMGVCNGLVCVRLNDYDFRFILFNPATRQSYRIPKCIWLDSVKKNIDNVTMGFGFHPSVDDYKLITMVSNKRLNGEAINHAEVYSWSSDSWKEIEVPFSFVLYHVVATPGKFFWEARDLQDTKRMIVSFDMSDEEFLVIEGPLWNWDKTYHELIELKGELALVSLSDKRCFTVWVLNENAGQWNKKFKFGPIPIIGRPLKPVKISSLKVVGCSRNGDIAIEDDSDGNVELFLCDLGNGEMKSLPIDRAGYSYRVYGFSGSLVQVKKNCSTHDLKLFGNYNGGCEF